MLLQSGTMHHSMRAGRLMSYMYATPTKDECVNGENWWYGDTRIQAGVWYTMYMHIKLNHPGACCVTPLWQGHSPFPCSCLTGASFRALEARISD